MLKEILFVGLLLITYSLSAQTEVVITNRNGEVSTVFVAELGKIYFSSDKMLVDEGNGQVDEFLFSEIQRVNFNALNVGVKNLSQNAHVRLYPNPSDTYFRIITDEEKSLHLQLYSLLGQLILDKDVLPDESVNISDLQSGIYFVKVNDVTLKLLKK